MKKIDQLKADNHRLILQIENSNTTNENLLKQITDLTKKVEHFEQKALVFQNATRNARSQTGWLLDTICANFTVVLQLSPLPKPEPTTGWDE